MSQRIIRVGMWASNVAAEPNWYLSQLEITMLRRTIVAALDVTQESINVTGAPPMYFTPLPAHIHAGDALSRLRRELEQTNAFAATVA